MQLIVRNSLYLLVFLALSISGGHSLGMNGDAPSLQTSYRLHFFHTHTGERLDIVYRHGNDYDFQALARLNNTSAITVPEMFTIMIRRCSICCMI